VFFGLIPVFAGVVYATMTNPYLLVPIAVVSTLGSRGGFGPVNMLEGVILAQACSDEKRTRLYAIRSTLNSVAVSAGSLFAGAIVILQGRFSLSVGASYMWMFGIYALLNLLTVALYSLLSDAAEVENPAEEALPLSPETRSNVLRLSLLFSVDSLGSGFVTQSLVSYWFFDRFGLGMDAIGTIFAASSLLAAVSFMLAARVSERIGLINTMVYSHLPANLMTMSIPYMPNLATSSKPRDLVHSLRGAVPPVPDGRPHAAVLYHGHREARGEKPGRRDHKPPPEPHLGPGAQHRGSHHAVRGAFGSLPDRGGSEGGVRSRVVLHVQKCKAPRRREECRLAERDLALLHGDPIHPENDGTFRVGAAEVLDLIHIVPRLSDVPAESGREGEDRAERGKADAVGLPENQPPGVSRDCYPVPNLVDPAGAGDVGGSRSTGS